MSADVSSHGLTFPVPKTCPPPVPARGAGEGADPRPAPAQMQDTTAPQSVPERALRPAGAPPVAPSALEKLRQIPTSELSLVQMVERFAGALHDHQNSARARGDLAQNGRDAALAEALKALTLFTESGFDPAGHDIGRGASGHAAGASGHAAGASGLPEGAIDQTERELRQALAKLQSLRGAA